MEGAEDIDMFPLYWDGLVTLEGVREEHETHFPLKELGIWLVRNCVNY